MNISFPIYNADGTPFLGLVLRKVTYESVVMSLGDKITGEVYFPDANLGVTMQEYVEYNGVRFVLVNPPTIVKEGMVSDNSDIKGMTKFSFVFYHPMYMLNNFPFSDVAVTENEESYLSQNKTFSWIGNASDFVAKLNANLMGTQWTVRISDSLYDEHGEPTEKLTKLSEVLSFDKVSIGDALKTFYETYEIPYVIDKLEDTDEEYSQNKRFVILVGLPSNEILDEHGNPFVFQYGQGVGLKNNSRNPKNNKIVTRIAPYGSENNIPYGYPQIVWEGNQEWEYTINNASGMQSIVVGGETIQAMSYPIYDGIVGGRKVRLIKHPFTRTTLMPSIYAETVNDKVNPLSQNYNPNGQIIDYYDATAEEDYPNPIVPNSPSLESHQFEDIKPELGEEHIVAVLPYEETDMDELSKNAFLGQIQSFILSSKNEVEKDALSDCASMLTFQPPFSTGSVSRNGGSYTYLFEILDYYYDSGNGEYESGKGWYHVRYTSGNINFEYIVYNGTQPPSNHVKWDDSMDEEGNYNQSYFKITLPQLYFDLYACAAITEEMKIFMRSGACIGCTFEVAVEWDDYKKNFYDSDGNFDPEIGTGHPRDGQKYPNSENGQITIIVKKDLDTFGTLMPNTYQRPHANDEFVILGISLPSSYIDNAQSRLDDAAKEYMFENNVYYFDYPLKFDEHFLETHANILLQIRDNTIVRFLFANELPMALYVKQIVVKYGGILPQYDITLTDDVEIVLNQIGKVVDDVSGMRVQMSELQNYYGGNVKEQIEKKLSKVADDIAAGRITFQQGLNSLGSAIFGDEARSQKFISGMNGGRGWRIDELGNAEMESLRVRSYLEVIELLVNRLQAQEGDTMFSDNDQVEKVDKFIDSGVTYYVLSLKQKWEGYTTCQKYGNILKGVINTLAANEGGVSDVDYHDTTEIDGWNSYYTSWMRVVATHNTDNTLGVNQIRVVLYGDSDVPALRNFEPCELMAIARWGCFQDPNEQGISQAEQDDRRSRQTVFYISTKEGRIVKLTGVNKPTLEDGNYGMVFGVIPDFVKTWDSWTRLVAEHPHLVDRDYLYAQGLIYQDLVHVDINGSPVPTTVFCGDWVDGGAVGVTPSIGNGIYFNMGWNDTTKQFETHTVRHNNGTWKCLQNQPVTSGGVTTYYEPVYGSPYWELIDGDGRYKVEIDSSNGDVFNGSSPATMLAPKLFFGNVDITSQTQASAWSWERSTESGQTAADVAWNNNHVGILLLSLSASDFPSNWSSTNKAIFKAKITIDGVLVEESFFASKISNGYNTAVVQLYKRSATPISTVGITRNVTYRFSTRELRGTLNGWSQTIPSGSTDPIYATSAVAYSDTDYDMIGALEWVTPILVSENGDDGINTAAVMLYQRSASAPSVPSSPLYYKFSDGVLYDDPSARNVASLGGWSRSIPATDGNPCWVTQAAALSANAIDMIDTSDWSSPQKLAEDGKSQPSYIQTQEAWSNVASVNSETTEPTPNSGWQDYTPSRGNYSYLWRRSRTMTLDSVSREYVAGTWSYQRLSGENGTSISIKGHVATTANLPTSHSDGDAYVVDADGHLYMWSNESNSWIDIGVFKGDNGKTYYTHIAWASETDDTGTIPPAPTGQTSTPNKSSVTGFSVSPFDGAKWMGFLINEMPSDPTSSDATLYTWNYAKGETGDGGMSYRIQSSLGSITIPSNSQSVNISSISLNFYSKEGSDAESAFLCYCTIFKKKGSTYTVLNQYTTKASNRSYTHSGAISDSDYDAIVVCAYNSASTSHSGYVSELEIPVRKQGDDGRSVPTISLVGTAYNNNADCQISVFNGTSTTTFTTYDFASDSDASVPQNTWRGTALAVINRQTLAITKVGFFDTWYSEDRCDALATAINGYDDSYFIALISHDAVGWSDSLVAKLKEYGCYAIDNIEKGRYPFAFLGMKGLGRGYALQMQCGDGSNDAHATVGTLVIDGMFATSKTGEHGKMSRNIYYAGLWSEVQGTTFSVDDYQAPYVNIGTNASPNCKVFVGENGTYTFPSSASAYNNSADWEPMTTDFKYLITKAIFSSFAMLGSSIFNEDIMLSQYGFKNGSASTAYQDMVIDANGKPSVFYPNVWMNFLLGMLGITEGALGIYSKTGVKLAEFGKNGNYGSLKFFDTDGTTELIDYGVEGIGYILSNSTQGGMSDAMSLWMVMDGANVNPFFSNHQTSHDDGTYYTFKGATLRLKDGSVKVFNSDVDGMMYNSDAVDSQGLPNGQPHRFGTLPTYLMETTPYRTDGDYLYYYIYEIRSKQSSVQNSGYIYKKATIVIYAQKMYHIGGGAPTVTYYHHLSNYSDSTTFNLSDVF